LFKTFEESVRDFKERYYGVRPITASGWKSIVYRGPRKDEDGHVVMGPQGVHVEEDYARFHFTRTKGISSSSPKISPIRGQT
ncbi:hypothetical protein A2U01_0067056, partial [Trifolium medium]|nr:hypothetical protein [Trifolium medium]